MNPYHKPVLAEEVLTYLSPEDGNTYLDCTLGGGGHTELILEASSPHGRVVAIDRDDDALDYSRKRLVRFGDRLITAKGNFRDLKKVLAGEGISAVDGVLFDLGVSSHQLDTPRGFSFLRDEPLDMRMNRDDEKTAADVVNNYSREHLAEIIRTYGEERFAGRVARAISEAAAKKPIETTGELADIVRKAVPGGGKYAIDPATRTFQALRIEVNDELSSAESAIEDAVDVLKPGGVICVISFHSLEDRITKNAFARKSGKCTCPPRIPVCVCGARKQIEILTKKPVTAGPEELGDNPRSRSAKLRCARKISEQP
ncbi:MAG: 16S rRNA (cytosine(1402)-N(4))-methyltransferase RsmH [Abditibacteriota bacterium]|nr:16S rRNA (cytosine(1402)-N(4))-methyltransferase RsmH [Abditibacteriota bacterium]